MLGEFWRRRREARIRATRAIGDALWQQTLSDHPLLTWRPDAEVARLRDISALFLAEKRFTGAQGFEITDAVAVSIAAQAALLVLHGDLRAYAGFVGIVVHPDEVTVAREVVDEAGIVHQYTETLSGEALAGGPVMLAWKDVAEGSRLAEGYNVVVHEFAHVLTHAPGARAGRPPLPADLPAAHWDAVVEASRQRLDRALRFGRPAALDAYALEHPEEYFPVATEAFFASPHELRHADAALYELLARLFRQDPAAHAPPPA